jgi:hypothetical protein
MRAKDDAAKALIDWHFEIEPELREVFLVVDEEEAAPDAPIKLLEVNAATVPTGSVEPFAFAPAGDIPYRVLVAEITPQELKEFMAFPQRLPRGWDLRSAKRFLRPKAA